LGSFGRLIGFTVLALASMAILAVLALLPAYAQLQQAQWELDCIRAGVDDAQRMAAANERLIGALATDNVLIRRVAMDQTQMLPPDEVVVDTGQPPLPPPDMVIPLRSPRPPRPGNWLLRAATKIDEPSTRRGLMFVSMATLLGALFLFAPPGRGRQQG
jgi:hypothetical protein